jgi:aspartyl protease family protein
LLRVGEVSPEGVELVSSSSREAVIEVDGRRHKLGLSTRIAATYRDADVAEVRIPRGSDSHYMAGGSINGHPVTMLVDTGATLVAMNVHDARRLGVQFRNGRRGTASTAGGRVDTFVVNLNTVRIGGLEVRNVSAAVLVGDYPETILLGNSLLDRLEMSQEAGVLVLRKKY